MTRAQASTKARQGWVLALASAASFMVALDGLVVITALTTIRRDLGASIAQLEWTVNAFTLSFAVLLMTGAVVGDRIGRRRVLIAGLGLFATASAACALAPDAGWLIAARAVQGAGAALVTPVALALVSAAFSPQRRGRALGIFSAAIGFGVLCGPVVGGAITDGIAWQWIFWLNVPIAAIVIALLLARVEESFGGRAAPDLPGVALVTGAALGLIWGLVRANTVGWGSAEVIAALAAGALLTIAFVSWEHRARQPMLPISFFRSRAFTAGNAVSFLLFASNLSGVFLLAQFQQETLGQGPFDAGLRLLPLSAALFLAAPTAGMLVDRLGERPLIVGGMLLQAAGTAWIALIAEPGLVYATMVAPMVLVGLGSAMAMPAAQKAVVSAVGPSEIGRASGIFTMMRWFGGVFGVAIAVAIFAASGGYASAQAFNDGFVPATAAVAGFALAGAIAGTLVSSRRVAISRRTAASTSSPALDARAGS